MEDIFARVINLFGLLDFLDLVSEVLFFRNFLVLSELGWLIILVINNFKRRSGF